MVYIFWIVFCILVGALAQKTGRNFWKWCLLSVLCSPLLIGVILLIIFLMKGNLDPWENDHKMNSDDLK